MVKPTMEQPKDYVTTILFRKTKKVTEFKNFLGPEPAKWFVDRRRLMDKWCRIFPGFYPFEALVVLAEAKHIQDLKIRHSMCEDLLYSVVSKDALEDHLSAIYICKYNDYICDLRSYRRDGKVARRTLFTRLFVAMNNMEDPNFPKLLQEINACYYRHFFAWVALELAWVRYIIYCLVKAVGFKEVSEPVRDAIIEFLQAYYGIIPMDLVDVVVWHA